MRKLLAVFALIGCLILAGCNPQQTAQGALSIAKDALTVVQVDIPNLPVADQAAATNWDNLGFTLVSQAQTCVAGAGSKIASISNCITVFGNGLTSPTELASLGFKDVATQNKIALYATLIVDGLNTWLSLQKQPTLSAPSTVTTADLQQLERRLPIADQEYIAWAQSPR